VLDSLVTGEFRTIYKYLESNNMKLIYTLGIMVIFGAFGYSFWFNKNQSNQDNNLKVGNNMALAEVVLPSMFSPNAKVGKLAYKIKCANCHGINAEGQDGIAPPLVHKIYEPSHHGDESFQRAVSMGVQSHHWRFGNMPSIEDLTRGDVKMIIAYIRELQRANGIN
jgi:cytochrome c